MRSEARLSGCKPAPPAIVGMWSCDLETEKLTWCDSVRAIFGLPAGASPDRALSLQCYHPDSRHRLESIRSEAIRTARPFTLDARIDTVSGEMRWMRIVAAVDSGPSIRPRLYGVKQDMTAHHVLRHTRGQRAGHDPMTGLAGTALFEDALLRDGRVRSGGVAILLVSLEPDPSGDRNFGDEDRLVQAMAERLTRSVPRAALIARLSRHRLAVLLRPGLSLAALDTLLFRLSMVLRRPVPDGTGWLRRPILFGAATDDPAASSDPVAVLARAERALEERRHAHHAPAPAAIAAYGTIL